MSLLLWWWCNGDVMDNIRSPMQRAMLGWWWWIPSSRCPYHEYRTVPVCLHVYPPQRMTDWHHHLFWQMKKIEIQSWVVGQQVFGLFVQRRQADSVIRQRFLIIVVLIFCWCWCWCCYFNDEIYIIVTLAFTERTQNESINPSIDRSIHLELYCSRNNHTVYCTACCCFTQQVPKTARFFSSGLIGERDDTISRQLKKSTLTRFPQQHAIILLIDDNIQERRQVSLPQRRRSRRLLSWAWISSAWVWLRNVVVVYY